MTHLMHLKPGNTRAGPSIANLSYTQRLHPRISHCAASTAASVWGLGNITNASFSLNSRIHIFAHTYVCVCAQWFHFTNFKAHMVHYSRCLVGRTIRKNGNSNLAIGDCKFNYNNSKNHYGNNENSCCFIFW